MRETPRRREIRRLLERRQREGLTYKELSAICGLEPSTLAGWSWRLKHEGSNEDEDPDLDTRAAPSFVEVAMPETTDECRFEFVLRSGRRLLVPSHADPEVVRKFLSAVDPF